MLFPPLLFVLFDGYMLPQVISICKYLFAILYKIFQTYTKKQDDISAALLFA